MQLDSNEISNGFRATFYEKLLLPAFLLQKKVMIALGFFCVGMKYNDVWPIPNYTKA